MRKMEWWCPSPLGIRAKSEWRPFFLVFIILKFSGLHPFENPACATEQVLPMQTGLYRYDEQMMEEINNKNLKGT